MYMKTLSLVTKYIYTTNSVNKLDLSVSRKWKTTIPYTHLQLIEKQEQYHSKNWLKILNSFQ